jgi:hypothetical protein
MTTTFNWPNPEQLLNNSNFSNQFYQESPDVDMNLQNNTSVVKQKRAPNKWNLLVKKTYSELRKTHPKATFADAIRQAKKAKMTTEKEKSATKGVKGIARPKKNSKKQQD